MRFNINLIRRALLVLAAFAFALAIPANAVLELTFNQSLPINRIQYYWSGDASGANQTGRIINSNKDISFNLADPDYQAKPKTDPPTAVYIFGADEAFPNSTTTKVRVWDVATQTEGGKYTNLVSYSNPAGTGAFMNFNINYSFIYADPTKPNLTKVDETTSKPLPSGDTTGSLKIYSAASAHSSGLAIEIAACEWLVNSEIATGQTSQTLTLSTPTWDLSAGTSYTVQVRYKNLWGDWGPYSDPYTHTIAGTGGAADSLSIGLIKYPDGFGINSFGVPFSTVYDNGNNPVTNLRQLIDAINDAGEGYATTIGFWQGQQEVGFTLNESGEVVNRINTEQNPEDISIVRGLGYQVSVTADKTLVLKNYQ